MHGSYFSFAILIHEYTEIEKLQQISLEPHFLNLRMHYLYNKQTTNIYICVCA